MTDHLPECLHDDRTYGLHGLCICDELRACKQRVLDAARAAVKALHHQHPLIWPTDVGAMQALDAAIDALKEKP